MHEPNRITRVAERVLRVPLRSRTLAPATRTNTFVIEGDAGYWIVDPGAHRKREHDRLLRYLERHLGGEQRFRGYFVTHHHRDHWAGLPKLLDRLPGVVVARDPALIGARCEAAPLERFTSDLGGFDVVHTPGHASDHLVIVTPENDVIAGDLVAGVGTVVINPPDGDMSDYLVSLDLLLARGVGRLFPAHGPTVVDGSAKLREYIAHRGAREQAVLGSLTRRAPARPIELVADVYGKEIPRLWYPLASRSVLAHLKKLEREGLASYDGVVWEASRK